MRDGWYLGGRWAGPAARPSGLVLPAGVNSWNSTSTPWQALRASSPAIHRGRILGAWARRARRLLPRQPSPDHAADRSRAQALVRGRPGRAVFPPAQGNVARRSRRKASSNSARPMRVLLLQSEGYPVYAATRPGLFLLAWMIGARCRTNRRPRWRPISDIWRSGADSFWHMPGMLKKRAKFVELAQDGAGLPASGKSCSACGCARTCRWRRACGSGHSFSWRCRTRRRGRK